MEKIKSYWLPGSYFLAIFTTLMTIAPNKGLTEGSHSKLEFWNAQRKGANIFNQDISSDVIKAAKDCGIEFIRLAPDKFPTSERDFLIGNADDYTGLVQEDLDRLKGVLGICQTERMPVVLTMLSLPGSRWRQYNPHPAIPGEYIDDLRIWVQDHFLAQAASFWGDLAAELQGYQNIVGYNFLNEPHPDKLIIGKLKKEAALEVQPALHQFYADLISAVRLSDRLTPIIINSSLHADAETFAWLQPHSDPHLLYSVHIYEPYDYTCRRRNQDKYEYPGKVNGIEWDRQQLKAYMEPVSSFQRQHSVPSNRILVGEFGGNRHSKGLCQYFKDLISIFQEKDWHFAFYEFRPDDWDGMDYELDCEELPEEVYGTDLHHSLRKKTQTFSVLRNGLAK